MLFIIGFITVCACVMGGYMAHGGNPAILWQPTEVLIICGAAAGSFMISNPPKVLKQSMAALKYLMKGSPFKKQDYVDLLCLQYVVFKLIKSKGMLEIESHIEAPKDSNLFSQYPNFVKNHHAMHFFCDYLRIMTMGVEDQYQIEDLMDADLEAAHHEHHVVAHAWVNLGDAFPALGIVAAVLGVIITMGSISEPPEILGKLIGAALVGTFLGILIAYGFVSPIGSFLGKYFDDEHQYLMCMRAGILSHLKGNAPAVTVEFARNGIPPAERPDFKTVEDACSAATA
ncbi:MAG: flagellar motor stator protein MotA [Rickettsiales bacterium]|nr:flagellar motor stator protein MotA [Rickettsiales bacterium]